MKSPILLCAALGAMSALLLPAAPAQAQNGNSFVYSTGGGTACTFAAPCNNFQAAHDNTFADGQIACIDSGNFGGAFITKSITIDCAGRSATSQGFTVNTAGVSLTVRNLTLALGGIDFQSGAALIVENCTIRDIPGIAIRFRPTGPGAQLVVSDTIIKTNSFKGDGGGIQVAPQSGGSAGVSLTRVTLDMNMTAMVLAGAIDAVMKDSVVSASFQNGIVVLRGALTIRNSQLIHNIGSAISAQGSGALVRLGETTITGNQTGVSQSGGGSVLSYKNNRITGNSTDGLPLTAVPGGATQ